MKGRFRILLTDCNRHVRAFLVREFTQQGYDVIEAKDCRDMQRLLRSHFPVHLLVFDPDIAFGSGGEMVKLLKAMYPDLPVVVHTFPEDSGKLQELEAFVVKKGSIEDLKLVVGRILGSLHFSAPKAHGRSEIDGQM